MLKLKLTMILSLGLISFNAWADPTILGFEETLEHQDKVRLTQFIADHKKIGHQKCYYHAGENTVVCEDRAGIIYPFR